MPYKNFNHPAFRQIWFGTGGVGKTTAFCEELKKQRAKIIFIYDHKHEFTQKLGCPCVYTIAQLSAITAQASKAKGQAVVCFDPCETFPGIDKANGFSFFCSFVYGVSGEIRGRKILVCDELQKMVDPDMDATYLGLCLDDGRFMELDFMGISHGANRVHTVVRAQATECYTFRQSDNNSIKILEKDYGFNPDEVRALRPGEWLWRNLNAPQAARGGSAFEIKPSRKSTRGAPAPGPALESGGERDGGQGADGGIPRGPALPEVQSPEHV